MSQEEKELLRSQILLELTLQNQWLALRDHDAFVSLVLDLGQQHGICLTPEDIAAALETSRRAWTEHLLN